MPEALLLDVDNTLTPPRRPLEADMAEILKRLRAPFVLVAGSDLPLIRRQFLEPLHAFGFRGGFHAFLCNGSTWFRCTLTESIQVRLIQQFSFARHVGQARLERLKQKVEEILNSEDFRLPPPLEVIGERIIDRGSMINVAAIGRPASRLSAAAYANREAFCNFDEQSGFRRRLMAAVQEALGDLLDEADLRMTLGGQTSLDFNVRGYDKSYPIPVLLEAGFTQLTYVGDALFPDGNDEAVLNYIADWPEVAAAYPHFGACPVTATSVDSPKDTEDFLIGSGYVRPDHAAVA